MHPFKLRLKIKQIFAVGFEISVLKVTALRWWWNKHVESYLWIYYYVLMQKFNYINQLWSSIDHQF